MPLGPLLRLAVTGKAGGMAGSVPRFDVNALLSPPPFFSLRRVCSGELL